MSKRQQPIPPMPKRLMIVPVFVTLFSIGIGVLALVKDHAVIGWVLIGGGIVVTMARYVAARNLWRNDPNYRRRILGG